MGSFMVGTEIFSKWTNRVDEEQKENSSSEKDLQEQETLSPSQTEQTKEDQEENEKKLTSRKCQGASKEDEEIIKEYDTSLDSENREITVIHEYNYIKPEGAKKTALDKKIIGYLRNGIVYSADCSSPKRNAFQCTSCNRLNDRLRKRIRRTAIHENDEYYLSKRHIACPTPYLLQRAVIIKKNKETLELEKQPQQSFLLLERDLRKRDHPSTERKKPTCSECGQFGHKKSFKGCPKKRKFDQ